MAYNLHRPELVVHNVTSSVSINRGQFLACTRRHEILKSKIKELPKFLSSSSRRGANFISVYNFSSQQHVSFGNQRILNFRVMAVLDINLWSCLAKKYIIISVSFGHLRSKNIRENGDVNVCIFSTDIISRLDNQSKFQMFTPFPSRHIGVPKLYTNMTAPYWAL